MEWLISEGAYKWRGLYLRGPINGGAYICEGLQMEWLISVRACKWRGLYLKGPINGVAYICEGL